MALSRFYYITQRMDKYRNNLVYDLRSVRCQTDLLLSQQMFQCLIMNYNLYNLGMRRRTNEHICKLPQLPSLRLTPRCLLKLKSSRDTWEEITQRPSGPVTALVSLCRPTCSYILGRGACKTQPLRALQEPQTPAVEL